MLNLWRRHSPNCKHKTRQYKKCSCPIWVQGTLHGKWMKKSLGIRNWESAQKIVRDWEAGKTYEQVSVKEGCERWLADCEFRKLKPQSLKKYRHVAKELTEEYGEWPLREMNIHRIRGMREKWDYSPLTSWKRIEMTRSFFSFCLVSGWIEKNPCVGLKSPLIKHKPTLPFSKEEWKDILMALDVYQEVHVASTKRTHRQLKALLLLMRYSGLRISDAIALKKSDVRDGKVFLYQAKTGHPVLIPLPDFVLEALDDLTDTGEYFFWNGDCALKTRITEWQERLKKIFVIAGIPTGHGHQLRDTFAVDLLQNGVPIETVATILGHTSIRTTEKHYSPWVKSRQIALEKEIKKVWG